MTAASRLLADSGEVAELSLRAVAREVGIAATSIYLHFRSLDELVFAVKARYFAEFGRALNAAADAAGTAPGARVRALAHEYVRYGLAHRGEYWVMFSSEMVPAHPASDRFYVGEQVFEAGRDEIAAVVGTDADATLLAIHFWTALHGIVMLRRVVQHRVRSTFPWPDLTYEIDDLIDRLVPALAQGHAAP